MMNLDLLSQEEKIETENGALGYRTTGTKLLDVSFKVPALRNKVLNIEEFDAWNKVFREVYEENQEDTIRFLLYLRDIRGGIGERSIFRNILVGMAKDNPGLAKSMLVNGNLAEYGTWGDVIDIGFRAKDVLGEPMFELVGRQLRMDICDMEKEAPVTLLAKWLPTERTSSKVTRARCKELVHALGCNFKQYRKAVSALRSYVKVIEQRMSAGEWDKIDYNAVPSKSNIIYSKAFMKHDEERRTKYLEDLAKGKEGVKINARTLMPYEIVRKYFRETRNNDVVQPLWDAMPAPEKQKNILVVRDGSSSMTWGNIGTVTAMDVGDAICLYMAKFNTGGYKDKFITFSATPQLVDLSKYKTLGEKLDVLRYMYNDYDNTDLERVFDLVLDTVIENAVLQEEIPDILCVSDMEFDMAWKDAGRQTLMQTIAKKWESEGYKLPKLIFWNVNSRSGAIPMKKNDNGVILVSGFSTSIANMVMSNELDPWKALQKVLHVKRYDVAKKVIELA